MQRLVPQILAEMDGLNSDNSNILFIGATNEPWSLDSAVLRPGRLGEKIYISPPDLVSRKKLFELYLKNKPLSNDIDFDALAQASKSYSGADIKEVCIKASLIPFKESIRTGIERDIGMQDLKNTLSTNEFKVIHFPSNSYYKHIFHNYKVMNIEMLNDWENIIGQEKVKIISSKFLDNKLNSEFPYLERNDYAYKKLSILSELENIGNILIELEKNSLLSHDEVLRMIEVSVRQLISKNIPAALFKNVALMLDGEELPAG